MYDIERVPNESVAEMAGVRSDRTLKCGTERACAPEREITENVSSESDRSELLCSRLLLRSIGMVCTAVD